jgi:hypothetical protein
MQTTAQQGRLKVFLGMAAGVGKTYRMLQEGQAEAEAGRDVVIGYLEPHGRVATEERETVIFAVVGTRPFDDSNVKAAPFCSTSKGEPNLPICGRCHRPLRTEGCVVQCFKSWDRVMGSPVGLTTKSNQLGRISPCPLN